MLAATETPLMSRDATDSIAAFCAATILPSLSLSRITENTGLDIRSYVVKIKLKSPKALLGTFGQITFRFVFLSLRMSLLSKFGIED